MDNGYEYRISVNKIRLKEVLICLLMLATATTFLVVMNVFFGQNRWVNEALYSPLTYLLLVLVVGDIAYSRWLALLHEGAHIAYACTHGVSCRQINLVLNRPPFVEVYNLPRKAWAGTLLFPLALPLTLIVLSITSPVLFLPAAVLLLGSSTDIALLWESRKATGNFITRLGNEIVFSHHPLPF